MSCWKKHSPCSQGMSHPAAYKLQIIILSCCFVRGTVSWYGNAEVSTANLLGGFEEEFLKSLQ